MSFKPSTLREISEIIGGELEGDPEVLVSGIAGLGEACSDDLTFLANNKYRSLLNDTKAAAAIVSSNVKSASCALIRVENPDLGFSKAVTYMASPEPELEEGIHASALVSGSAVIGGSVRIGANTVIEDGVRVGDGTVIWPGVYVGHNSVIGDACTLKPNVAIYHNTVIKNNVIIHAGAVVGSDGFGYAWDGSKHVKIPQVGTVVVEDDVEIGANTCIDRARFGVTRIGKGAKLDNLIQIAHNVDVGPLCAFAAMVGVAGSTKIGAGTLIGGKVGIYGHVEIGAGVQLSANAGVTKNLPGGGHYTGYPAKPHKQQIDDWRNIKAVGTLRKKVKELEERINCLES